MFHTIVIVAGVAILAGLTVLAIGLDNAWREEREEEREE